jgi:mutual gliding-motility protein MglA
MVLYKDGSVYIKLVYWGMAGCGKTTILETLYKITKEKKKDIIPVEDLRKIEKASGATLYFDSGLFQSTKQKKIYYRVFTVAGQSSFSPLRSRIFEGTDAVIFVVDSQTKFFEDNVESLMELKNVSKGGLIKEFPLIIMLNKQDLDEVINEEDFKYSLKEEKLWYDSKDKMSIWNPIIYKTCALYEQEKNIYRSFYECARRTVLYQIYGDGKAPIDGDLDDIAKKDNLDLNKKEHD